MPETIRCTRCGSTARFGGGLSLCAACALESDWLDPTQPLDSAASPRRVTTALPPGDFGDYQLLEELGSGGMGIVYRALQISLNRHVALKFVRIKSTSTDQDLRRFRAEANVVARLRHPGIVAIHEIGEHHGQPYFAMEWVTGRNLSELLLNGPLPPERAARYVRDIAAAIQFAHTQGILHRDLKPQNLILDESDHPKILDFGLAKYSDSDSGITCSGAVLGSPSYMSPEQAASRLGEVDHRSDVYSLGAVLYELITNRAPFRGATPLETLRMVVESDPVSPRSLNPGVPRDLEIICLKCLSKSPGRRYASAAELGGDLDRFLLRQPIQARPLGGMGRLWLWTRREPLVAGLALAFVILLLASLAAVSLAWHREIQQRLNAQSLETVARENLYAADMNLALQAVELGDDALASQLLSAYDPLSTAASSPQDPRGFEWRHLRHTIRADPHRRLKGHAESVTGLAFSRDGTLLYSAGSDGWLHVQPWDATSRPQRTDQFGFHASSLALHPSKPLYAIGGDVATAGAIKAEDGRTLRRLQSGHIQIVVSSPDGRWLLCGRLNGWNGTASPLLILDWDGNRVGVLEESGGHMEFSRDGTRLVTGDWFGKLKVWQWDPSPGSTIPTPRLLQEFGPAGTVLSLSYSPEATRVASVSDSGELQLWNVAKGELLGKVDAHSSGRPRAIAFSPDGRRIATGGEDRMVRIWDAETLGLLWVHRGHRAFVWSLAWQQEGLAVVSADVSGAIRVWSAQPPPIRDLIIQDITADFHSCGIAFSPDSKWISARRTNGDLCLFDCQTGTERSRVHLQPGNLHVAFPTQGAEIVVSLGIQRVERFSVPDLAPLGVVELNSAWPDAYGAQLSPNGHWLAGLHNQPGNEGSIELWDARRGTHVATLRGHEQRVRGLRFSNDNRWLASGSLDHTARIWDLTTFQPSAVLHGSSNAITTLSFTPDSQTLATGGWDDTVRLWRVPSGELLRTMRGSDGVPIPEFFPDNMTLGVMTQATGIRLFRMKPERNLCTLRWPDARPYRYARISPDGTTLACYSQDHRLRLWRAPLTTAPD